MRTVVPFGCTVTIVRTPEPELPSFGDVTGEPETFEVDQCVLWPTSTQEILAAGQDTVIWDMNCFMPPGTDICSGDKVQVGETVYDVWGHPQRWESQLAGRRAGVEVQLKAATG